MALKLRASADLAVGALDRHVLRSLSFVDALLVQAAVVGGCEQVLSEDLQHWDACTACASKIPRPAN